LLRKRWKEWEDSELLALDDGQLELDECQRFDWEGMEETEEASFKIGLELDLDEGTLDYIRMIDVLEL